MATACITHSALKVHGISKPIIARFDQPQASSDGGAILIKAVDDRLGLTWRLASVIRDHRQPGKITHPLRDLLRQRIFGLACGYADCNDAARLVDDPIHKLLLERDPLEGAPLGSQPTLSRFENAAGRADLYRLGTAVADTVLLYHRERLGDRVPLITIDLDATDDPTHGQQELALFNGYYDTWCYLPLVATVMFNTEPMQHVVAAVLRPGTGAATRGVRGLLRRLFSKLRTLFPNARLRGRAAAGFAEGKLLAFRDAGWRDALRGAPLGPQAAHHHESRGALPSRPVAQGQSAVSGHEPAASAGDGLHAAVLRAWRHGEPAQGTAAGAGHGPHELLPLCRQPASAVVLPRGLRPVPGLAGLRPRRGRRPGAGLDAARALAEGRRMDRALGATHRAALPASLSVAGRLAATRAGTPRDLTPRADWPAVPKTDVSLAQRRDDHPCDRRGRSLTPRCRHRRPARSFRRTNSQPSARWSRRALGRVHS